MWHNRLTQPSNVGAAPVADRYSELSVRQQAFIDRYTETLDPYNAALEAGYSRATARSDAYSWIKTPFKNSALYETAQHRRAERLKDFKVEAAELMAQVHLVATADPRELTEIKSLCCRWCHGADHAYQWTPAEYESALARAEAAAKPIPDMSGGLDFDRTRDVNPDCPECAGAGVETIVLRDTRDLSASALALYKGVRQTKNGIEVLMHDQDAARRFYAQLAGFIVDKKELTGAGGQALLPTKIELVAYEAVSGDVGGDE